MPPSKRGKRKRRSELKQILLLLALKMEGPVGRYRLKDVLGLPEHEGLVRMMLSELKKEGHVFVRKTGCELTEKGKEILHNLLQEHGIIKLTTVDLEPLNVGPRGAALHIKNRKAGNKSLTDVRDAAVKAGATGAIILTYKNGLLEVPRVYADLSRESSTLTGRLLRSFNLSDGDVIIVGFSDDIWRAMEGALSASTVLTADTS